MMQIFSKGDRDMNCRIHLTLLLQDDKICVLQLLTAICNCGTAYKQLILEEKSDVVQGICRLVSQSDKGPALEISRILLVTLGQAGQSSNTFQQHIISLLQNPQPHVQRTGSQVS